jgi:hypothetical protein
MGLYSEKGKEKERMITTPLRTDRKLFKKINLKLSSSNPGEIHHRKGAERTELTNYTETYLGQHTAKQCACTDLRTVGTVLESSTSLLSRRSVGII